MEKNTMKWLSRRRLPKSFLRAHTARERGAKKESTARLLFAQQPHPAGGEAGECWEGGGGGGWGGHGCQAAGIGWRVERGC